MVKKVNKGNKVPYKGYLLNMGEYEEYQKYIKLLPDILRVVNVSGKGE